ncbi:alpha-protein kinase 2 [Brienomyrus brachyistius]|uniref:alpha-protein kinase 2 n=1 Tax=Brienomyrus brachyistius TaxID=42636 RepID=UPI0020B25D61|nr:alpha-protein kinase 2 [Brienomyrus brachyistius]
MDLKIMSKQSHKISKECAECKPSTRQTKRDESSAVKMVTINTGKQVCGQKEKLPPDSSVTCTINDDSSKDDCADIGTITMTERNISKSRSRKKKRKSQNSQGKVETEPFLDKRATSGLKTESKAILSSPRHKTNEKTSDHVSKKCFSYMNNKVQEPTVKNVAVTTGGTVDLADSKLSAFVSNETLQLRPIGSTIHADDNPSNERHLCDDEEEKQALELQPKRQDGSTPKDSDNLNVSGETFQKKSYSAIVKERMQKHNRVPKILQNIHILKTSDDLENISLCCQFSGVSTDCFIAWMKEGALLVEEKISKAGDSEFSFTITKASSKDLGWYKCCLRSPYGNAFSEFHLTSDELNELVPCHNQTVQVSKEVGEDVKCAPLLFRGDFLCEQFFGDDQPASILTEEAHFGEGMHRKAFRTKVLTGLVPLFNPGHHCVLKVHNAISYGTKNNEELIHKNYNLAVEECHVQNTAREYIKAYTAVAKSAEIFGEVPEIIPIYLVHRPTSDIPYATLEEELLGEFVKYSVKDGKEMNLMRQDSEAGQKCCTFQHWVYHKTEGNLLVTDMQGVGMKLTDVGIATCKKGYKGFKGNCATSFIEQFKALHQCNKFCQLLGLKSIQACQQTSKRPATATKPKAKPLSRIRLFQPSRPNAECK